MQVMPHNYSNSHKKECHIDYYVENIKTKNCIFVFLNVSDLRNNCKR